MGYGVASSPHVLDPDSTPILMRRVCWALVPALAWGWFVFGRTVPMATLACLAGCLAAEEICRRLRRAAPTLGDGSAVVTALLLACVLPPNIPLWQAALGGVFAIGIGKHAFGGLGANIWNPALLARAFLQNSRPVDMMSGDYPWLDIKPDGGWRDWLANFGRDLSGSFADVNHAARPLADAVSRASPLAEGAAAEVAARADALTAATALTAIHNPPAAADGGPPAALLAGWDSDAVWRTWIGFEGGNIGEVSAVLLLAGGLYLLWKRVISWEIPVVYLAAAGLLGWLLPHPYRVGEAMAWTAWGSGPWLLHLGAGGLMIGAWFMATDPVTGPLTRSGKLVFAAGCGLLTLLIRLYGGYPEGVCYSILIMNTCVPLIDSLTRPRVFGKTARP